jgi:hypothetical protein
VCFSREYLSGSCAVAWQPATPDARQLLLWRRCGTLLHASFTRLSVHASFTRLFDLKGGALQLEPCTGDVQLCILPLHASFTRLFYTPLLHASLTCLVCTPLLRASIVFSWNHARATCSSAYCRAGTFSSASLSTMRSSEVTRLFYTTLLHASFTITRLFYTPLLYASFTRLSYTPLVRCDACLLLCQDLLLHASLTRLSYTPLLHASRKVRRLSTPLSRPSLTRLSYTPFLHASFTRLS